MTIIFFFLQILTAHNDMVSRVLDLDRDRQNRIENRLDHLLDVVQTAVLNKSSDKDSDVHRTTPEPVITNLVPPPKPGVVPPKLDLVPPKPCRVACTNSNVNNHVMNHQNPVTTRPGVVSPISPSKRVGAIWSKLGPVSTSPFVKAQQQLGFRPIQNIDARTQSSAERRIAKEFKQGMDSKTLKIETLNLLDAERRIQEVTENARIEAALEKDLSARRRLYLQKEPSAASILTAAFLEAECQSTEMNENGRLNALKQQKQARESSNILDKARSYARARDFNANNQIPDNLLSGQGDSYERLRQLKVDDEDDITNPFDSSTPAKPPPPPPPMCNINNPNEPRKTVQQLAQLVLNSAQWQNVAVKSQGKYKDFNMGSELGKLKNSLRKQLLKYKIPYLRIQS